MTELLTLAGDLIVDGVKSLPPDAVATVKVVDAGGEVLAAGAVAAVANPIAWSATIDPALAPESDALLIWAMVRSDDGVWGTPELRKVASAVTLVRVDGQ